MKANFQAAVKTLQANIADRQRELDEVEAQLQDAVTLTGAFWYENGTGPFTGSVTLTSAEGDLLAFRYDAFVVLGEEETTIGGVLTGLGGAGRWADVTGYGHVTGSRSGLVGSPVAYAVDLWLAGMPAEG